MQYQLLTQYNEFKQWAHHEELDHDLFVAGIRRYLSIFFPCWRNAECNCAGGECRRIN